jgi:hypothetical protein
MAEILRIFSDTAHKAYRETSIRSLIDISDRVTALI